MSEGYKTFAQLIDTWLGGAGLNVVGALLGRSMWHVQLARKGFRRFLGREIIYELPIVFGMALIGEGLASWLGLQQTASTGLIAMCAYLGPRGAEVTIFKWFGKKPTSE